MMRAPLTEGGLARSARGHWRYSVGGALVNSARREFPWRPRLRDPRLRMVSVTPDDGQGRGGAMWCLLSVVRRGAQQASVPHASTIGAIVSAHNAALLLPPRTLSASDADRAAAS